MKAATTFYWATTSLIALETFTGGVMDLAHGRTGVVGGPFVTQVIANLGYPVYVLAIVGLIKIPGAITLVVPGFRRLKEWAYAGIVFELSGAVASHAACREWGDLIAPLSLLGLAIASCALRPPNRVLGTRFNNDGYATLDQHRNSPYLCALVDFVSGRRNGQVRREKKRSRS